MPRLRNAGTGVVVNVSDDVAAALGAGWSPVEAESEQEAAPEKPQTRRRARKTDN